VSFVVTCAQCREVALKKDPLVGMVIGTG